MKKNVKKSFKNLQISKKSCIFASNISNLCYIKDVFMKNRNFIRLVYRKDSEGVFVRSNGRALHKDFPFLPDIAQQLTDKEVNCDMFITKVKFFYHGFDALAWIDKHDNVIVRYMSNNKQTKINF